jgi:large subunit ribosomal protein L24
MKIKQGDTVLVTVGKDKGKKGKVLVADPKKNTVIVQGVNIQTRHEKAKKDMPAEIRKIEGPISASNVMYFDGNNCVRIGYKTENGHKVRINKKTGQTIK